MGHFFQIGDGLFEGSVWVDVIVRVLLDRGIELGGLIPEIICLVIVMEVLDLNLSLFYFPFEFGFVVVSSHSLLHELNFQVSWLVDLLSC